MHKLIFSLILFVTMQGLFFINFATPIFADETWQKDSVPTNILDYGKLGKILKQENLVTTTLNSEHHPETNTLSGLTPNKTLVEVTIEVQKETFMKLQWATIGEPYLSSRASSIKLNPHVHRYRLYLPRFKEKTQIRIDPGHLPGEIIIKNITFKSLYHEPIQIDSQEKFKALIPKNDIAEFGFDATRGGLRIVSKGNDPQLEMVVDPKQHIVTELFKKKRKQSKYLYKASPYRDNRFPSRLSEASGHLTKPYPIISVVSNHADLFHPDFGIIPNKKKRGRRWEKPAAVSYYENGKLLFESNAGLRIHGGKRVILDNSYRLYFRDDYGKQQFAPGLLFGPRTEPLKRLVIHHTAWPPGWPLNNIMGYEIARAMGCVTPEIKLAHLVLNGQDKGLYFLTPHQGDTQLASFFGHQEFSVFRHKSGLTKDSVQFYKEDFSPLLRSENKPLDFALINQKVDLDNLARHLFSFAFCATTDYCQGVMARDNQTDEPKIFWMNWDMDHSFIDVAKSFHGVKKHANRKLWEQPGWSRFLAETNTYCKRKDLFKQLVIENPQYGRQVAKMAVNILNHRVTKTFLVNKLNEYETLLKEWGDYNEGSFNELRKFFNNRHEFMLTDMQKRFKLGSSYHCRIRGPKGISYTVDGFTKEDVYEGRYFEGMQVNISLADNLTNNFSHWLVNGTKVYGSLLAIRMDDNMNISPVFGLKQ